MREFPHGPPFHPGRGRVLMSAQGPFPLPQNQIGKPFRNGTAFGLEMM